MVDQDVMKTSNVAKEERIKDGIKEQESRFGKVKRMLADSLSKKYNPTPTTYEEAKVMCKARKRKERQESIGSISQERKVIRSNSEEKLADANGDTNMKDIRRVVSHEDFQKTHPLQEHNETIIVSLVEMNLNYSPKNISLESLGYDDCEHERRRHHERFAPVLTQRGRRSTPGRKYKPKHFSKTRHQKVENGDVLYKENGICSMNNNDTKYKRKENIYESNYLPETKPKPTKMSHSDSGSNLLQLLSQEIVEKEASPSPSHTPVASTLDLSTLHQQIDSSEPMPSSSSQEITDQTETLPSLLVASNRMLSSPRNSIIATQRIYLDPNIQQTKNTLNKEAKTPLEKKLKSLSKQINSTKRKIKGFDDEFQVKFGYKPSQADKMNDKNIRKSFFELGKLKKEYKQLKGETTNSVLFGIYETKTSEAIAKLSLEDTLLDIEKNMLEKRFSSHRTENLEEMTNEQIIEEKVDLQKSLLYLESIHGRPVTKEDRDLVRPLYDRYRCLKRMVSRVTGNNSVLNELATIHEHETMDFISSPPQLSESETGKPISSTSTDSDTDISFGESYHNLSLTELIQVRQDVTEEKKKLKRTLKEFENDFQMKTGRKVQKDDKLLMTNIYTNYKQAKAKLRLLDALVAKQTS